MRYQREYSYLNIYTYTYYLLHLIIEIFATN